MLCASQACARHHWAVPTHIKSRMKRPGVLLPFCCFSSKPQGCLSYCENYVFPPTPIKIVISKFWTWRIKKKSYTLISKEGIHKENSTFCYSWQREIGSFKNIQYPLVVLIQIESIYQFNPYLVEIKSKENYKALFRKLTEHSLGIQRSKSQ